MENGKFCSFNTSKNSFLSSGVNVVDTIQEPLVWSKSIAPSAGTGIWLKPFRGIPPARRMPAADLIYLDEGCRVLQGIELSPTVNSTPMSDRVVSALVLPPNTLSSSQTYAGDQLVICAAEELARQLAGKSSPVSPTPVHRSASSSVSAVKATPMQPVVREKSAPVVSRDHSLRMRVLRWLNNKHDRNEYSSPGIVAFYWANGTPQPRKVRHISCHGFYLLHEERWPLGTSIEMSLQWENTNGERPGDAISVRSKVVRWGTDGMGFEIDHAELADTNGSGESAKRGKPTEEMGKFLSRLRTMPTAQA